VEVPLWRRCFRVVTGKEGQSAGHVFMMLLQLVAIFGLFVDAGPAAATSLFPFQLNCPLFSSTASFSAQLPHFSAQLPPFQLNCQPLDPRNHSS
jgi:hypothetical protein